MTVRGLVATALRLFAIWSVVIAFEALTTIYALKHEYWSLGFVAVAVVVEGAVFLLLWGFASAIARRLVPEPSGSSPAALDARGLLRAGACLIGLSLVAAAVPNTVKWLAIGNSELAVGDELRIHIEYAVLFVQLAIAAFFLFGNGTIARVCLARGDDPTRET